MGASLSKRAATPSDTRRELTTSMARSGCPGEMLSASLSILSQNGNILSTALLLFQGEILMAAPAEIPSCRPALCILFPHFRGGIAQQTYLEILRWCVWRAGCEPPDHLCTYCEPPARYSFLRNLTELPFAFRVKATLLALTTWT